MNPQDLARLTALLTAVGGFKYWTMGNPLPETTLINRKTLDADKP
jgi:hypothetical protein